MHRILEIILHKIDAQTFLNCLSSRVQMLLSFNAFLDKNIHQMTWVMICAACREQQLVSCILSSMAPLHFKPLTMKLCHASVREDWWLVFNWHRSLEHMGGTQNTFTTEQMLHWQTSGLWSWRSFPFLFWISSVFQHFTHPNLIICVINHTF